MKKYCYATLITTDNFLPGAIIINESLRRVKTQYPFICLVTKNISQSTLECLEKCEIQYKIVDSVQEPPQIKEYNDSLNSSVRLGWYDVFSKFRVWQLTDYEKVIFLDADLLILKNLDHCFEYDELTAAVDGEYFNCWPHYFHFNSGFMVLKPSDETFNKLMAHLNNANPKDYLDYLGNKVVIADQDVLNSYFKSWYSHAECRLNKYYDIFGPYLLKSQERDILENAYFIHFVGCKPWYMNKPAGENKLSKPNILNNPLGPKLSVVFYAIAYTLYLYVLSHKLNHINWELPQDYYSLLSSILLAQYNDAENAERYAKIADSAGLIAESSTMNSLELKKKCLINLFTLIYKDNIFSNVTIYEILCDLETNRNIDKWYNTIIDLLRSQLGRF